MRLLFSCLQMNRGLLVTLRRVLKRIFWNITFWIYRKTGKVSKISFGFLMARTSPIKDMSLQGKTCSWLQKNVLIRYIILFIPVASDGKCFSSKVPFTEFFAENSFDKWYFGSITPVPEIHLEVTTLSYWEEITLGQSIV